jgi:squalene synthase HpnC
MAPRLRVAQDERMAETQPSTSGDGSTADRVARDRAAHSDAASAQLAAEHYENFPVGSWLLPRRVRHHVHRLYAFARIADDIADERQDLDALREYREETRRALAGATDVRPLLRAVRETAQEREVPERLFFDLLDAFERDLSQTRYRDLADLHDYCRQSADPVGRAMLAIFGKASESNLRDSDRICTALQILNHLQDIRADFVERDRIYLPADRMRAHGVTEGELDQDRASPQLCALIEELGRGVHDAFAESWPLARRVGGRFGLELNAILHGAHAVLRRLSAGGYDPLAARPKLRRRDAPGLLARALFQWKAPPLP